ncbi:lipase member H-like isoform X2 [Dermacentor silvarum]|uniref:lipase member H-like isoform X2 n=1 Tax=Dermacentor silvarum TaxID=543639 RepID=UPI002101C2CB|nr:lipase member H-like isoform X2 [Dermacentor silvarum]
MDQRLFSKTSLLLTASFSLLIVMTKALPHIGSHKEDCNVIIVDWRREARRIYPIAVAKAALVGRRASRLLQRLVQRYPDTVGPELVHVVGFSLGAQIAGFFARNYRRRTKQRIWRITALDPAAPEFAGKAVCVHQGDARFVDVIHTSGGKEIIKGHLGIDRPVGDVDFYPNGGKDQPGCTTLFKKVFAKLYPCHHMRAPLLFLESIRNKICRFVSKPCEGGYQALRAGQCNSTGEPGLMGFYSYTAHGRGVQTLDTNSKPAYCKKQSPIVGQLDLSNRGRPEAKLSIQKMP